VAARPIQNQNRQRRSIRGAATLQSQHDACHEAEGIASVQTDAVHPHGDADANTATAPIGKEGAAAEANITTGGICALRA